MILTLIHLKHPCSACLISCDLVRDIAIRASKIKKIEYHEVVLENLNEICKIKGVEAVFFPIIMIDNEQVTAGNIITLGKLLNLIEGH